MSRIVAWGRTLGEPRPGGMAVAHTGRTEESMRPTPAAVLALPALALALCLGGSARAQSLEVLIDIDTSAASQAGIDDAAALQSELEGQLDTSLVLADQSAYMEQMADANVLSAKGMGVDYASKFERFIIGGGFGSAVNSAGFTFSRGDAPLPSGGFAFQATVMAGLNLGGFNDKQGFGDRVRIYANGLYAPVAGDPFSGELLNYGGHVQLALLNPSGEKNALVRFAGLDLTTGYERSRYVMTLDKGLPIPSGDVTWDADGSYRITSDTQSVPVELSTGLKIAIVSAYIGAAADINLGGGADGQVSLGGPLSADDPSTGQTIDIGSASVTASASGDAAQITPRGFGGVMVHVLFVKLTGHLNVTLDRSVGGHVAARVAF